MARGIFTLSRVRTKKIKDEWVNYSDVWQYQGNPVNRSAYGFPNATVDIFSSGSLPISDRIFTSSTVLDKLSFDTETASPLPGLDSDGNDRWVLANSRDAYHCGGGEWPIPSLTGADAVTGGFGQHAVNKISFSNDSKSSIPSITLDRVDYDPVTNYFADKTKGLENTLAVGEKQASTIGNNEAGYIIGGKKYDRVDDDEFNGYSFTFYYDYGYASSQYYKITYSNDAKAILPGYSTGQSYKGAYFLTFGNLDRGYVGGGEAAGIGVPRTTGSFPTYAGSGPWSYHHNSAMFRLTYSTETSARVPSLDLGAYQAGDYTYYRSPSFSNGADGNSTEAYTMGRDSSSFETAGERNASSNINKITFSTETISAVSGANRSTYVESNDAWRKEGFDVRSASSGTSVYAMAAVESSSDRFADKFNISSGTVTTLTSTGLRTNMFASATGQGKPYQGGYQIPFDRGSATNYYGQPGTPPVETPAEDPDFVYSGGPTYGYVLQDGMYLHKLDHMLYYQTDQNGLKNPRFNGIGINLRSSWMKQGNLTVGTGNGWHRWLSSSNGYGGGGSPNGAAERAALTLPVLSSAALSNRTAGYVSGGCEFMSAGTFPITTNAYPAARSGGIIRSDTHKISYIDDTVTYLPSSNLPREKGVAQHGGNTSVGYVLAGYVNGTENAQNSAVYVDGPQPFNTDCEKITYSTETYSTIPTNVPSTEYASQGASIFGIAGHTIGTMDYLYYGGPTPQKFTFSTENLSALPNVPGTAWNGGGYTRTSDGVNAMLYGHDGNTNIGRIQFSTDTLVSAYTTLPNTANYLSGNGDSTYSWYSGGYFRIITEEGRIYQQDTSTGSIFHISSNPWQRGPNNTGHKYYGACNENNGMGGPEQRNTKYNEKTLV